MMIVALTAQVCLFSTSEQPTRPRRGDTQIFELKPLVKSRSDLVAKGERNPNFQCPRINPCGRYGERHKLDFAFVELYALRRVFASREEGG